MLCSLAAALSLVDTLTMPLASISKVTSICGTPRGAGGHPNQIELGEEFVVGRHLALPLEDADGDCRLIVLGRRENLAALGRYGSVAIDQLGHDAAKRFDSERQRRHVEQENVLDIALQHPGLDRRTDCDHFVRVDTLVRLPPET